MAAHKPLVLIDGDVATLPLGDTLLGIEVTPGVDFPFLTASSSWTINHNFGYRPQVQLRNLGHVLVNGDVSHPTVNQAVVEFVSPFAGYARCT